MLLSDATSAVAWTLALYFVAVIDKQANGLPSSSEGTVPIAPRISLGKQPSPVHIDAIVIGGGPVGLGAALILSSPPHNCTVHLFETSLDGTETYDPTRAYLYNVNSRGQRFTSKFPQLQTRLEENGVASGVGRLSRRFVVVPAKPSEPLPCTAYPDEEAGGSMDKTDLDFGIKQTAKASLKRFEKGGESARPSYWIQRHDMIRIMRETIEDGKRERERTEENASAVEDGSVCIVRGMECKDVRPTTGEHGSQVEVVLKDQQTQEMKVYATNLVVGADGINSKVRQCLACPIARVDWNSDSASSSSTGVMSATTMFHNNSLWHKISREKFQVKKYKSPATGLRLKALQFPPRFRIPDQANKSKNGTMSVISQSTTSYVFRSVNTGPTDYISLGLLPVKDENAVRASNVITRPNHQIWTIRNGEEMRKWFEHSFPRLPFGDDTLIDREEWDRFANAQGTTFPHCQHSTGVAHWSVDGRCGVVLVGDALHAYPPDIGQGVNSGLLDVLALGNVLEGVDLTTGRKGKTKNEMNEKLGDVLRDFERERLPETKALIRLARFGAPYQYRQPSPVDKVGRFLWNFNILLRVSLNKISSGLIPTAAALECFQNPNVSFRQAMGRADIVTAGLSVVAFMLLTVVVKMVLGILGGDL